MSAGKEQAPAGNPATVPADRQLTPHEVEAIVDLSRLAAALPRFGYHPLLDAAAKPPQLVLTYPGLSEPQHIMTEDGFYVWHNSTGHHPFAFRHHPPGVNAHAAHLVAQAVIHDSHGKETLDNPATPE